MNQQCGLNAMRKWMNYLPGLVVVLSGCESGSTSPALSKNSEPVAAVAVEKLETAVPKNETVTAPDVIAANSKASEPVAAPTKQSPVDSNPTSISTPAPVPKSDPPQPAPPIEVKPIEVKPSEAQVSQWAQPVYAPLDLLAFRQSDQAGLVSCMASTPDGKQFVLAGTKVTLWSIKGLEPEHTFLDIANGDKDLFIKSLAISPDGKWIAAGNNAGTIRIWDLVDRKERISKKLGSTGIIQIAISPDSQELATTSYSSEVTVWDATKLESKNRFKVDSSPQRLLYMAPDQLVSAGQKTTLWNVRDGKLLNTLSPGQYNSTLGRSADGKWFAFGEKKGLRIWDTSKSTIVQTLDGQIGANALVEFSPDGQYVAIATGFKVTILDVKTGAVLQVLDSIGWTTVGLSWLPESNLLLIAKEDGSVRFWGARMAAEAVALQPMHQAIQLPDSSSKEPAFPSQLLQAIDLRSFPKLPNSKPGQSNETMLNYESDASSNDAMLFHRYMLGARQWTELPANPLTPDYLSFQKNGFKLFVSISKGEKGVNVSLANQGNFDLRWAPRFDGAPIEVTYENENTVIYKTKAELLEIETNLLRKMHDAGWTAYSRLNSTHNEQVDARGMEFIQNGIVLNVSINKFPADPENYSLNYSGRATIHSIPIPKDCGFVEFSSATEPLLVANTKLDLVQTQDFYDREMQSQGWLPRKLGRSAKEDRAWLPYFRGQQDVTIGLNKQADNLGTRIRVGTDVEKNSWQLTPPPEPAKADKPKVGIEAADFPILNASKVAKIELEAKTIDLQMDSTTLASVEKLYTEALSSLGWKPKDGGVKADDYLFITFAKDRTEIDLRGRMSGGNATINLQGDGLLWSKPLAGGNVRISFESWLRKNHRPASLSLLQEYEAEMKKIPAK